MVRWLREGARGGGGPHQQEVRGLRPKAAKLWAADGGEETVVRWLREGARGGGERLQEVRGLPVEVAKLCAAVGEEEGAVVFRLRAEGCHL